MHSVLCSHRKPLRVSDCKCMFASCILGNPGFCVLNIIVLWYHGSFHQTEYRNFLLSRSHLFRRNPHWRCIFSSPNEATTFSFSNYSISSDPTGKESRLQFDSAQNGKHFTGHLYIIIVQREGIDLCTLPRIIHAYLLGILVSCHQFLPPLPLVLPWVTPSLYCIKPIVLWTLYSTLCNICSAVAKKNMTEEF